MGSGVAIDWVGWHEPYADETTPLSRRLRIIQGQVRHWLDHCPPGRRLRVLSLCAGDGRDLLEVLADRPEAERVEAVLVEITPELAERARSVAAAAGLDRVQVRTGDAGDPHVYADCAGADLLVLAGLFGNISDADVRRVIRTLPMVCGAGARVIWTRHRKDPDLTPAIRACFADAGFVEQSFTAPADAFFTVGVHDFQGTTAAWSPPSPLFTFVR